MPSCTADVKKLRILYVANSPQIGGGNRSLLMLAEHLRKRGSVPLFAASSDGPLFDACRAAGFRCTPADLSGPDVSKPLRTLKAIRGWHRLIVDEQIDVVHANDALTARPVLLAAWLARRPVVCHVQFPPDGRTVPWIFRGLPKPAAFVFNSLATRQEIGETLRKACPYAAQEVVFNGVDVERFMPAPREPAAPFRAGIVANLLPIKGHQDFIDMARILTDRRVEAEYWIIGEDIYHTGYRASLERRSRELGLDARIHFLGHRSDVPTLLQKLDVLVSASHVEPFGIGIAEAMACGRPVVGTRVGGIPEVLEDGVTGWLAPPRAPQALADAVERLYRDPAQRMAMGTAGRERALRLFSAEAHSNGIMNVYAACLRTAPLSPPTQGTRHAVAAH